jgi:hypothetical protein
MRAPGVILVECSPYESALAYVALTRETPSVIQVPDLSAARRVVAGGTVPVKLAILGPGAIASASDQQIKALQVPAVGIAARLSDADRQRALAAGVRAVYTRPRRWKDYLELIAEVLATRTDSERHPTPTN